MLLSIEFAKSKFDLFSIRGRLQKLHPYYRKLFVLADYLLLAIDPIYLPAHLMHHEYDLNSDSTNPIDLRVLLLDLRVTVYPDGRNRPVGVSRSTTSWNTITEISSQIKTFTTDCRSHRPYPIYISHMQMIRTYNEAATALIPLKGRV